MQPKDWVALFSLLATTGMAIFTIWFNYRNLLQQREREDAIRTDERGRAERETQLTRLHEPHIEFTIDARFFGPIEGQWLAEVSLIAHNVGSVIQHFSRIHLRIRGIPEGEPLKRWEGHGCRAEFPMLIAEEKNIIPKTRDGKEILYFAEPGVRQTFTYMTTIPRQTRFVLIFAEFDYYEKDGRTHDCERVFALNEPASSSASMKPSEPTLPT